MEFVAHHLFICSVIVNLGLECGREVFMSRLRKRLTLMFSFGHCPNYLLKCRLFLVSILGLRTQIKVMAYLISLLQNMLYQNRQIQHKSIQFSSKEIKKFTSVQEAFLFRPLKAVSSVVWMTCCNAMQWNLEPPQCLCFNSLVYLAT